MRRNGKFKVMHLLTCKLTGILNNVSPSIACLALSIFSSGACATKSNITIDDFAYGIDINTKNKQAIQAFILPAHFYEHLRNPSLSDYRVFDSRGQVMPSRIKNPSIDTSKTETKKLNFYPIRAPRGKDLDALSLSLDRKESKLSVVIDDSTQAEENNRLMAYVIENNIDNNKKIRLETLNFEWEIPATGFIKNIQLEHSSDLMNWSTLKRSTSLSRLQHQNRMIGNNKILIGTNTKQYIRLSWSMSQTEFVITEISANYHRTTQENSIEKQYLQPRLKRFSDPAEVPVNSQSDNLYILTLPGSFPVSEIEISSSIDNYFFQARLFSGRYSELYSTKKYHWLDQGQIEQYHLLTDDQVSVSAPKQLNHIKSSEWLFDFAEPKNLSIPPDIKITWQPEYLLFITQGIGPYTLAYGNPQIPKDWSNTSRIINQLSDREWHNITQRLNPLTAPRELGGAKKLLGPPAKKPWKPIALWAVLILGVMVMAWMVFRLIRDTGEKG